MRTGGHARNRGQRAEDMVEQLMPRVEVRIPRARHAQVEREDAARIETGIDPQDARQARDEERRADKQHHGQRQLAGDEYGSAPRRVGDRPSSRAGSPIPPRARGAPGRRRGEQYDAQRAPGRRAPRSRGRDRCRARRRGATAARRAASSPRSHELRSTPGGRPKRGDDRAFDEQLDHQPGARGAERGTDAELARARQTARELQAGQVRAGDEQHEARRRPPEENRRPQCAAALGVERTSPSRTCPYWSRETEAIASAPRPGRRQWPDRPSTPGLRRATTPK